MHDRDEEICPHVFSMGRWSMVHHKRIRRIGRNHSVEHSMHTSSPATLATSQPSTHTSTTLPSTTATTPERSQDHCNVHQPNHIITSMLITIARMLPSPDLRNAHTRADRKANIGLCQAPCLTQTCVCHVGTRRKQQRPGMSCRCNIPAVSWKQCLSTCLRSNEHVGSTDASR